jgi:transcriptional regulator with XRE-family HTH domain
MKLGDLIAQYRATHDLSQRQFALRCDLSNGYISMLEKGINPATQKPVTPTIPQLKKLADGMCMTLTALLEQVDDMPIDLNASGAASLTHLSVVDPSDANPLTFDEQELIRKYRALDDRGRASVRNTLDHEYASLPGEKARASAKNA